MTTRGPGSRWSTCWQQPATTSVSSASAIEALQTRRAQPFDVIITDLQMPGMDGLEFIRTLAERKVETQIVMVTALASVASAVEAMRHGAFDYIEKPFDVEQLEPLVARAMRHGEKVGRRSSVPAAAAAWEAIMIGQSEPLRQLRQRIAQVAPTDETVLITGESGTGKELVARCLHAASRRSGRALVSLNCPVLSPQLMESELFGHERGAFTSADAPRVGRFELADGGTILLDEITEIDLPLQAKLLRVLAGAVVRAGRRQRIAPSRCSRGGHDQSRPAGGSRRRPVPPRSVLSPGRRADRRAAAARAAGRRAAAWLTTLPMQPRAVWAGQPCELTADALELLCHYHWPGNVRELENIVTRASVLAVRPTSHRRRPAAVADRSHRPLLRRQNARPRRPNRPTRFRVGTRWKTWNGG